MILVSLGYVQQFDLVLTVFISQWMENIERWITTSVCLPIFLCREQRPMFTAKRRNSLLFCACYYRRCLGSPLPSFLLSTPFFNSRFALFFQCGFLADRIFAIKNYTWVMRILYSFFFHSRLVIHPTFFEVLSQKRVLYLWLTVSRGQIV